MMTSTAAKERNNSLERMARQAITQYNKNMASGGEPLFPDWALNLICLVSDYDKMASERLDGKRGANVVQFKRAVS